MKAKIQKFGRALSGMVMPNIGAFIAWGLITALFIPTGWLPNENLAELVGPMITYLLPLLIAYSAGNMVAGQRGAVIASIATTGLIVGSTIPMFLGAMIMGPLSAYAIKLFDRMVHKRIPTGFEMLVNNFSLGIIGAILALLGHVFIGGLISSASLALGNAVEMLVEANLLPLVSIIVEPAKVLFLNNAINHGVFTPLGTQEAQETGKSILFLIETNPGPGLGILLAYMFFTTGKVQQSSYAASIIHFFGGIHEVYFPYVLMRPALILAAIAGGISGVTINMIFDNGLVASPSPGSIFALIAVSTRSGLWVTLLSVAVATGVSFVVAGFILKLSKGASGEELYSAQAQVSSMKAASKGSVSYKDVKKIAFCCDAGMGSSAMGASLLRNKAKQAGLDVDILHYAVSDVPGDIDFVITQEAFKAQITERLPNALVVYIDNFMDASVYEKIVADLKKAQA